MPPALLARIGVPQAAATGHVIASKLDGALAEIAQRYPTISADRPLSSLHSINPAARFRLSIPLAVPEVALDAITTDDVEVFRDARKAKGLSASAINHDLRLLRKMFNWAIWIGSPTRDWPTSELSSAIR